MCRGRKPVFEPVIYKRGGLGLFRAKLKKRSHQKDTGWKTKPTNDGIGIKTALAMLVRMPEIAVRVTAGGRVSVT
jgi:hypothetical protein